MKKLNKFFAVLVALAMMATLAVTMSFAEDGAKQTKAPLVKTLTLPSGEEIPDNSSATFTFSDFKVNGAASDRSTENNFLTTLTIDLNTDADGAAAKDTTKNTDTYTYTTADVLKDIKWERAGVYTWTVSETGYAIDDGDVNTTDVKGRDESSYLLTVVVKDDGNGNFVVDEVIIKKGSDDPTPTYGDSGKTNGLSFANTYYTTTGNTDPTDPKKPGDKDNDDAGLAVSKTVAGDRGDKTHAFEITVDITAPQIGDAATPTAVIRAKDGTTTVADLSTGKVNLKDGETLLFTKIAVGTKVKVKETDALIGDASNQYTAAYKDQDNAAYTENNEFAIKNTANSIDITNTLNSETTPPTGILINNLPYIVLALVAVGGLVAYVVVRRKADDEA